MTSRDLKSSTAVDTNCIKLIEAIGFKQDKIKKCFNMMTVRDIKHVHSQINNNELQ